MTRLEAARDWARSIEVDSVAAAIEEIGFECTRCGRCCRGSGSEPHTATVFPGEVRSLQERTGNSWDEIARPMPFGLQDGAGETFEWALQTTADGTCTFLDDGDRTRCTVYGDRPLLCQTYPFRLALPGTGGPESTAVERVGRVEASTCPGLGRPIDEKRARAIAERLVERAIRELEETIALREQYEPQPDREGIVVHDSEGAKRPDGRPVDPSERDNY